ncbi:hypothetical protein [Helicobacter acinonychis]|uniref:Lipoprotein n=1 Tax=Helicobacter acinonychis (strain Sheeba) TaxID=382638 RepID=Q17VX2_HELAH|nr:hypothetical protein [Helicobacter acinonychis]CAK00204.1 hypothetical protein Hac_1480 [Helicobacter acinonychis str. Sheeba]STP03303.1 putative lipoprotein [Helicobacter acinonychis]
MRKIILVAVALLMSACASYKITPENVSFYKNGIQVMTSTQAKSKVQLEIAQSKLKGLSESPLVLYVAAQVLEGNSVVFDRKAISVSINQTNLEVLSLKQVMQSSFDFEGILQSFNIRVPTGPVDNVNIFMPSMFYYGQGSFLAYGGLGYGMLPYGAGYGMMMMDDVEEQEIMQESRQALKILAVNYLKKNTLNVEGKARGGFVVVSTKNLKTLGVVVVKVFLDDEIHTFKIDISKM